MLKVVQLGKPEEKYPIPMKSNIGSNRAREKDIRDYRSGSRIACKWSTNGREAVIEWYRRQPGSIVNECTFAVLFHNGKRVSSCFLKDHKQSHD